MKEHFYRRATLFACLLSTLLVLFLSYSVYVGERERQPNNFSGLGQGAWYGWLVAIALCVIRCPGGFCRCASQVYNVNHVHGGIR